MNRRDLIKALPGLALLPLVGSAEPAYLPFHKMGWVPINEIFDNINADSKYLYTQTRYERTDGYVGMQEWVMPLDAGADMSQWMKPGWLRVYSDNLGIWEGGRLPDQTAWVPIKRHWYQDWRRA